MKNELHLNKQTHLKASEARGRSAVHRFHYQDYRGEHNI